MARPRVEKVESNLKSGVVAQPGQKTLILGKNGIGKSAIVNAIELAGTGKASDVAGRSLLAKDADLFMLAPPGAEKVWATVRFTGEGKPSSSWELSKGHRAKLSGLAISFPLRDVQEALLGSPETARKWILQMGGSVEWGEVLSLVPDSLHKHLASIVGFAGGESAHNATNILPGALEESRRRVREANATAKAARTLSAPAQPPPTAQDFTALETIIGIWRARGDESSAPQASALEALREAAAAAVVNVAGLQTRAVTLEQELAALPQPPPLDVPRAGLTVIDALVKLGAKECAICGAPVKPLDLANRAARGRQRIDGALQAEEQRRAIRRQLGAALDDLQGARRERDRLGTELARAEKHEVEREKEVSPPPDLDLASAEEKLRSLHSLKAGWEASKRSEERALAAERDATEWGQLSEALAKALGTLVEKARSAFCTRVQKFLPPSDLFGLDLLDGEREVLRVGLLRLSSDRMVLHAALSGAEWARVTAALALATAPETGPCVVCPEERAFDPATLSGVLDAFDAALGGENTDPNAPQIIVTSPVPPTQIPNGWTVIQLGEEVTVPDLGIGEAAVAPAPAAPAKKKPGPKPRKPTAQPDPAPAVTEHTQNTFHVEGGHLVEDEEERRKKIASIFD